MLEMDTARIVYKAINSFFKTDDLISFESVCRMQPVAQSTDGSNYTILALQFGDLTIMVWVQFSEESGIKVREVKTQAW